MAKQKELQEQIGGLMKNQKALEKQCKQLKIEREKRLVAEHQIVQLQKELASFYTQLGK